MKFKLFGIVWNYAPALGVLAMCWSFGTMASPFMFMDEDVSKWWMIPFMLNFLILVSVQDKMYSAITLESRDS